MRRALFLLSLFAGAVGLACASSEDEEAKPSTPPPVTPISDAASDAPLEAEVDAGEAVPRCSPANWCKTELPDVGLVLRDIAAFPTRAFAVAESATAGVKVLEWEEATDVWKYIDDQTQGEFGYGPYVGRMWAPSENEIYYTIAPGTVYHGKRSAPGSAFSWSRRSLADNAHPNDMAAHVAQTGAHEHGRPFHGPLRDSYAALGVWGTAPDDVYAWYSNTIYHFKSEDGGAPDWVPEYVASDLDSPVEDLYILAAGGTRDDVWFSGGRSYHGLGCPIAIHKTAGEYRRVVDGLASSDQESCKARAGALFIPGSHGWLTDIQVGGPGKVMALKAARDVVEITVSGSDYTARSGVIPLVTMNSTLRPQKFYSLWWLPSQDAWLASWSSVVRGKIPEVEAGAYEISTVAFNDNPLSAQLYRVHGTSNSNLWAIGAGYALHKTTP